MNWIRDNQFLAGLLTVTVVGAGVLLFLLLGARSQYEKTADQYAQQTAELQRLQALKPYPEEANFARLTAQKAEHAAEVRKLRERLSAMELAKKPISPEQFQDSLRSKVSAIEALAAENGVALPEGFYLGFPAYQGSPPRGEATERLGWELNVIESVVRGVINAKVASIDSIERQSLPEESGGAVAAGQAKAGDQKPKLVSRYPFTLAITGEQSRIRTVLNQIANTKEQFLIARTLKIENEQTVGPPKVETERGGAATAPSGASASSLEAILGGGATPDQAQAAAKKLEFILGTEKLKTIVTIDIVDFAESAEEGANQANSP